MSHYERFARNAMMYDFGFDNSEEDESVIQGWIDYLDRTFDLVLITDYFDESMVLMKVYFINSLLIISQYIRIH